MIYNLSKDFDRDRFKARSEFLLSKGRTVELTEKTKRSLNQNNYLYLLFGIFSMDYGCSIQFVKEEFFKKLVNPDIFIRKKEDKIIGEYEYLRSTADLTKDEMVQAISKFKIWSDETAGIFLPDSLAAEEVWEIEKQMQINRRYL